jgi:hypothetical protein
VRPIVYVSLTFMDDDSSRVRAEPLLGNAGQVWRLERVQGRSSKGVWSDDTSGPFMINESFRRAGPPAMRKRTAAPANPTRLPTNAFVIMALRMMGTSPATLLLQLPGGGP